MTRLQRSDVIDRPVFFQFCCTDDEALAEFLAIDGDTVTVISGDYVTFVLAVLGKFHGFILIVLLWLCSCKSSRWKWFVRQHMLPVTG